VEYFRKMKGTTKSPPSVSVSEVAWSWVGAFLGLSLVGIINSYVFAGTDLTLVIGSFGASAVLIYGAIRSPLAQPRNLLGGHMLSAIIGVATYQALHDHLWLAAAVAVATAIAVMHVTKTLHPPGGATALIAVIGGESIHAIGYWYVLVPAGLGAAIMLIVALLINNIPKTRRYPEFWF
jgi:CBS-domain-containing membrane protein